MSQTMSALVRSEDGRGPTLPAMAVSPEPATQTPSLGQDHAAQLRELVQQMRHCVVNATVATDRATKIELWEGYRKARAEAIAMLCSMSPVPGPRRLHSI